MKTLTTGDIAPNFILLDHNGKTFSLKDHRGQKLIVYFYPKNDSAVCTTEACAFRDAFIEFQDLGVKVIGINAGSVDEHHAFAKKNRLPFTLLSDPGNAVLRSFGIKPFLFLTGRETFVIDEDGKIAYTFRAFLNGAAHPQKVLDYLAKV